MLQRGRPMHTVRTGCPILIFKWSVSMGTEGTLRCSVGDDRLWQNPRCISKPDRESFPFRRRDAPHSPTLFLGKRWECASSLQFQWQKCSWPTRRLECHWALRGKRKRWIHKDRRGEMRKWNKTWQKENRLKEKSRECNEERCKQDKNKTRDEKKRAEMRQEETSSDETRRGEKKWAETRQDEKRQAEKRREESRREEKSWDEQRRDEK